MNENKFNGVDEALEQQEQAKNRLKRRTTLIEGLKNILDAAHQERRFLVDIQTKDLRRLLAVVEAAQEAEDQHAVYSKKLAMALAALEDTK